MHIKREEWLKNQILNSNVSKYSKLSESSFSTVPRSSVYTYIRLGNGSNLIKSNYIKLMLIIVLGVL